MDWFSKFQLVFLILFYLTFLGRTIILSLKGVKVFVLGNGKKGFAAFLEVFFFIGLVVWSYELVRLLYNIRIGIVPDILLRPLFELVPLKYLGVALTCGGYLIFILALKAFGESWRIGIDKDQPGSLVTNGIFRRLRNPIFLFVDLYFWSTWLIISNWFFLLAAIVVTLGIHYQILEEERFLEQYYGESYREYKSRSKRYI
ncbi:MAG TPA: isoprenylcysteine carboxylmethyltransferase family protein [Bacillota bacterium]|nr:isoprenylcysteine carboxylmethyltransferase family protein [Bacillota bacterium]HOL08665.1 isoprenylcysteine carboxylmethyltransferase family protein [Bacillota bacterium]HPO96633.1 isoprenylcysteine carboxylmethyltransferase family protein [Bacillota bacterium]